MKLFTKTVSGARTEGHSVYQTFGMKFFKPKSFFPFSDSYLDDLRKAVRSSVSTEVWEIIGEKENRTKDPEYIEYTEKVRRHLIEEFDLHEMEDEVKIGLYHCDMFVISFPKKRHTNYPYYYMGIQLKPFNHELRSSRATQ